MTEEMRQAHARLLAALPVRRVGDMDDPRNWAEKDRDLTPSEAAYAEEKAA